MSERKRQSGNVRAVLLCDSALRDKRGWRFFSDRSKTLISQETDYQRSGFSRNGFLTDKRDSVLAASEASDFILDTLLLPESKSKALLEGIVGPVCEYACNEK